ncbi:oligosaccharide flippase family protein [Xenorhabdus stockiae]|uniref:oligosaccharide flippase family protein n=1 Tax=Xenorhabdus stockiae TaxID=351614 RepID=UPI00406283D3
MSILPKILNHSIFKNSFLLGIIHLLDLLLPIILIPYLTRILSPESFGLLIVCISIYSIANILTDFGFSVSSPYLISKNKKNNNYINSYLSNVLFLKSILLIIAITIIIIYFHISYQWKEVSFTTIILLGGIIFSLSFQIQWFFLGLEKMKIITIMASLCKFSYFFLILSIVPIWKSVNSVLFCTLTSNMMALFFYVKYIKKEGYTYQKPDKNNVITIFKENLGFFISRLSVSASTAFNGIVVGSFLGVYSAALYGTAEKVYNAAIGIIIPISNSIYPYMTRTKNAKLLLQIAIFLSLSSILFCFFISNYTPFIFSTLFGESYRSAYEIFNIFLILIPINIMSILYGYPAFSIIEKTNIPNHTVIISSILYIVIFTILFYLNKIDIKNILYSIITIDSLTLLLRVVIFHVIYLGKKTS